MVVIPGLLQLTNQGERLVLIPAPKSSHCPACGQEIPSWFWQFRRFYCPACGTGLAVRASYFKVLKFVAALTGLLGVYALGIGGPFFTYYVAIAMGPVFFLLRYLSVRIFPVDLEETTYVPLPQSLVGEDPGYLPGPDVAFRDKPFRGVAPKFEPAERSGIVEWVISAALIAAVTAIVAGMAVNVLDRVFPDPVEIKRAGDGFALQAALGADTIAFTNLSGEEWSCEVLIGTTARVGAAFRLTPRETREIRYLDFRPSLLLVDALMLRGAAHDQLEARCTESSGLLRAGLLR